MVTMVPEQRCGWKQAVDKVEAHDIKIQQCVKDHTVVMEKLVSFVCVDTIMRTRTVTLMCELCCDTVMQFHHRLTDKCVRMVANGKGLPSYRLAGIMNEFKVSMPNGAAPKPHNSGCITTNGTNKA
eukprot:Blabericola_migrator_1__10474@NODE_5932_length_638_cov_4_448336_g3931_i0_p2_GENE_NODE_5932_length_638_cov_4_448336_g3931_i0NODE_5932_length_638_cov_4_448336_g3931_i0_p2_ORF_typecomplete_len126_score6_81ATPgrasp/PF02222_22/1_9_NODE_5932_length_638_cov_4_448336_g3931_i0215592